MRPVCFGRVNVAAHGTPVKFGTSVLGGSLTADAQTLTIGSAVPFTDDMFPCIITIDSEDIAVLSKSSTTFTVRRGMNGTTAAAHLNSAPVAAKFKVWGFTIQGVLGVTGKMYFGTRNIVVASAIGIIKEIDPISSGLADFFNFNSGEEGNPLNMIDFALDSAADNDGAFVTFWVR